jgi:glucose dehydrogenase
MEKRNFARVAKGMISTGVATNRSKSFQELRIHSLETGEEVVSGVAPAGGEVEPCGSLPRAWPLLL